MEVNHVYFFVYVQINNVKPLEQEKINLQDVVHCDADLLCKVLILVNVGIEVNKKVFDRMLVNLDAVEEIVISKILLLEMGETV